MLKATHTSLICEKLQAAHTEEFYGMVYHLII